MKRKASHFLGSEAPAKLKKDSTNKNVDAALTLLKKDKSVAKAPLPPAKWPSFSSGRQRKAPSWLTSYVTNSAQEKEVKSEKSKPKLPRFPTLVPPSKQKELTARKLKDEKKSETPALLRKQSTIKLETPSEPAPPAKTVKKEVTSQSPTIKKSREISKSLEKNSDGSLHENNIQSSKPKRKITVLNKPHKSSNSISESQPKATKTVSTSKKCRVDSDANTKNNSISNVVETWDDKLSSNHVKPDSDNSQTSASSFKSLPSIKPSVQNADTLFLPEKTRPNMLEVVICVSTSGALRDYLSVLQESIREMIWRLQVLVPNLRIGVMAHTQGGIHDGQTRTTSKSGDHNYNRVGGHGGTKWLDLGATLSQICAFVDSLESEPTVYPDYVQDNVEMALWKLQRCMSWSSCSYRTVIMVGHGRPNRTSFYLQKDHWRSWIRSALELKPTSDIPVIDWELEAKLLAEMGIHVFTVQGCTDIAKPKEKDEDEGSLFFRRVAELTRGQHVRLSDPSRLVEIILGICCACHGPELLLDHRDTVRDDNDGVLPSQLTEVFVSLQLHSKSCSLASLPSLMGNLDIAGMRQRLNGSQATIMECSDEEEAEDGGTSLLMEVEEIRDSLPMELSEAKNSLSRKASKIKQSKKATIKENNCSLTKVKGKMPEKKRTCIEGKHLKSVKGGRIGRKNAIVKNSRTTKKIKEAVKSITKGKAAIASSRKAVVKKREDASKTGDKPRGRGRPPKVAVVGGVQGKEKEKSITRKQTEKLMPLKRKAVSTPVNAKRTKQSAVQARKEINTKIQRRKIPDKTTKVRSSISQKVKNAKIALQLKAAKTETGKPKRGRPKGVPKKENNSTKGKPIISPVKSKRIDNRRSLERNGHAKVKKSPGQVNGKTSSIRKNTKLAAVAKKGVKALTKTKTK